MRKPRIEGWVDVSPDGDPLWSYLASDKPHLPQSEIDEGYTVVRVVEYRRPLKTDWHIDTLSKQGVWITDRVPHRKNQAFNYAKRMRKDGHITRVIRVETYAEEERT